MSTSMRFLLSVITMGLLVLGSVPTLAFAQTLGQGYSCDSGKIIRKGKQLKLAVAKSQVTALISKLGTSKRDKAKKVVLSALKKALSACAAGSGVENPGSSTTVSTLLTGLAGSYEGTFTGVGGSPAAGGVVYLRVGVGSTLSVSLGAGDSTQNSNDRFTNDIFVGTSTDDPVSDISTGLQASAKIPFTARRSVPSSGYAQEILFESNRLTFRATGIPAVPSLPVYRVDALEYVLDYNATTKGFTGTFTYKRSGNVTATGTVVLALK